MKCAHCDGKPVPITEKWLEPLCQLHFDDALRRPPTTELSFTDGHREMRSNYVYGAIYRDVESEFDSESCQVLPIRVAWFERESVYRDERSGKPVRLFYRQIADPTPKTVRTANTGLAKPEPKPSWWRRFVFWLRLRLAMRGVSV